MDSLAWLSPAETHRALTHPLARQPITCTCSECGLRWQSAPQKGQGRPLECPKCRCDRLIYAQSPLSVIAITGEAEPVGDGRPLPALAEIVPLSREAWEARVRETEAQIMAAGEVARTRDYLRRAAIYEYAIIVLCILAVAVIAGIAGGLD